jgi:regulator of protease activity HflC (stomatin/prohibitin superfamily)
VPLHSAAVPTGPGPAPGCTRVLGPPPGRPKPRINCLIRLSADELLGEREKINQRLLEIVDRQTDPWGVKVALVEVKHVDLPQEILSAMARQAIAEREKRAKIIHAEGELLAATKLVRAAEQMDKAPSSLQLRYLQALIEMSSDRTSTVVFSVPIDTLKHFMGRLHNHAAEAPPDEELPAEH